MAGSSVRWADTPQGFDYDAVLGAAGDGERWALTELFRAYQPMVLRYLRGQEPAVADDLAGEVWVAVARRLQGFRGDERGFRGWLFTIARCRVIEHRRRAARRRTIPLPGEALDGPAASRDGGDPAAAVISQAEAQRAVDLVVGGLPPDQAEAVLLRVLGGFDVAEVARIMGRTPGSVRVLCHRALRRLAARLPVEALAE